MPLAACARSLVGAQPAPFLAAVLGLPAGYDDSRLAVDVAAAVPALVATHPVLFGTLQDARSRTPGLTWLALVRPAEATVRLAATEVDSALEEVMGIELDVHDVKPLWRVFVARLRAGNDILVGVVGHHALFDGSAILAVGRTLVASLAQSLPGTPTPVEVVLPATPAPVLHPALEQLVAVAPSTLALVRTIVNELVIPRLPALVRSFLPAPPLMWAGSNESPRPRGRHHRTLSVPPARVDALLAACRAQGVTITSFLHAALAAAIRPLADGLPFESVTNVDARRLFAERGPAGAGSYVGVVYATVLGSTTLAVWEEARAHHARMRAPGALRGSVRDWGMLAYVPDKADDDWPAFFRAKVAGPKTAAFELSNLGRAAFGASPGTPDVVVASAEHGWPLKRAIFSQTPLPMSAVAVFSVLSCETGMEIAVGWEDGVADVESVLPALAQLLATAE